VDDLAGNPGCLLDHREIVAARVTDLCSQPCPSVGGPDLLFLATLSVI